jgi:tetratricopeptide (TPR) repeat protein
MTVKLTRYGVIALVVIALIALGGFVAACGGNNATTTTASSSTGTSSSGSTDTTAASTGTSTNDTTLTQGGKTLDQYKAEVAGLEKAVQTNAKDLDSLQELAIAYYQLSEYEQAAAAYTKMLALNNAAFTHNNLGNVYRDWKKYDQAISEYKTAISLDPTLKQPYINLSGVYKTQGDLQAAVKILDQAKTALNSTDQKSIDNAQKMLTSTTTTT